MICGRYLENPPPFTTLDAFAVAHPGDNSGTHCSNRSSGDGSRIDFVLVWKPVPNAVYPKIDATGTRIVPPYSNAGCASDHRALVAEIEFP